MFYKEPNSLKQTNLKYLLLCCVENDLSIIVNCTVSSYRIFLILVVSRVITLLENYKLHLFKSKT